MAPKPTILLVPGAWHPPTCWAPLTTSLINHGYKTLPITTPTVGNLSVPFNSDVAAIRNVITAESELGNDVLLVAHSYGGVPSCCAVEGLTKADLSQGGVVGMVFVTSWMLDSDESILENAIVDRDTASQSRAKSNDAHEVFKARGGPATVFYDDLSEAEQERHVALLQPHKYETVLESEVSYAAWRFVECTYLLCKLDKAILYETQLKIVARARGKGISVKTEELEAGHSPFLSMPEVVVGCLRRAAGEVGV